MSLLLYFQETKHRNSNYYFKSSVPGICLLLLPPQEKIRLRPDPLLLRKPGSLNISVSSHVPLTNELNYSD